MIIKSVGAILLQAKAQFRALVIIHKIMPALAGLEIRSAQDGICQLMLALFNLLEDVIHLVHHFLVCCSSLLCPGAQSAF